MIFSFSFDQRWLGILDPALSSDKSVDNIKPVVDINFKDRFGENALIRLLKHQKVDEIVDTLLMLIKKGIGVNVVDKDGENALHLLFRHQRTSSNKNVMKVILSLLKKGIRVDPKREGGQNELHFIFQHFPKADLYKATEFLVNQGLSVDKTDDEGRTVLHYLCEYYKGPKINEINKILNRNYSSEENEETKISLY